jgi:hypothetical protein
VIWIKILVPGKAEEDRPHIIGGAARLEKKYFEKERESI